jgi:UDP-glucose 4-epimerase
MRNLKMGCAVCAAAAAKKPAQLIYASSDAVYPLTDEIVSERTVVSPTDLYGLMHLAREIMLAEECQIPLAVLRFTAVYGAGNPHNSYGPNRFIAEALRRGTISLFGAGEELRDHLYIDDAVAVLRSTIAHASGGLLNVASGSSVSFHAVAEMVARVCPGIKIMTLPRQLPIVHRRYEIADTRAAFPRLKFTPIDKGLWATIKNTAPPSALAETWTTQPLDFCGTVA